MKVNRPMPSNAPVENELRNDEHWRDKLSPEEFAVCRLKGTEPPGSGRYYLLCDPGLYKCACCGLELFSSDTKYDSGSGWPSFFAPIERGAVEEHLDKSHYMIRTEIACARCGSHLGHVFDDGPEPTGLRYCVNSLSLRFEPRSVRE